MKPRENDHHFLDDIFKIIFLNENVLTWLTFQKYGFNPMGPVNNIPALVQIVAWRRPGDKPLSELMLVSLLGLSEASFYLYEGVILYIFVLSHCRERYFYFLFVGDACLFIHIFM